MIDHPPVTIDGFTYTFEHLAPITLDVDSQKAGKVLAVRVSFANHCYTTGHEPTSHPEGWPILRDGGGRARTFCPARYALSQQMLPMLIQQLNHPKAQVRQTKEARNWVHSTVLDLTAGSYAVFFQVRRAAGRSHDLDVVVESAYARTRASVTLGSIGFVLLCGKVYRNEPVATRR